jgi:PqqD family protein of HPr-rel-A system
LRPSERQTVWQVVDPELVVRAWPDESECVAFSPLSGDVHLLSQPARRLLRYVASGPLSFDALVDQLARDAGRTQDEGWVTAVEDALTALDRAGLIEPRVP